MFPFSTDLSKYTEISSGDANARRHFYDPDCKFVAPLNIDKLPQPLQKVNNLVAGYVSGVTPSVASPVGTAKVLEVDYTARYDVKDAPATGNAYAYCVLQVEDRFFVSPPCNKLGDIPHHFEGKIPFEYYIKPKDAEQQGIKFMTAEEMEKMFAGVETSPERQEQQPQQ